MRFEIIFHLTFGFWASLFASSCLSSLFNFVSSDDLLLLVGFDFLTACPVQATASSEVAVKSQSLKQSLGYQILHWTLFSEGVSAQHKTPEVRLYCTFLAQRWCEITCRYLLSHSTPDSLWLPSPRLQVGARTPVSENHFGCNLILLFNTQKSSLLTGVGTWIDW